MKNDDRFSSVFSVIRPTAENDYMFSSIQSPETFINACEAYGNASVNRFTQRVQSVINVFNKNFLFIAIFLENPRTYQDARHMAFLVLNKQQISSHTGIG